MPITRSAKKALGQSQKRRKQNLRYLNRMKEAVKKVDDLIGEGKNKKAKKLLPQAYKAIDKAAKKNVIHKNTAARKKSRLTKRVNKSGKAEPKAKKGKRGSDNWIGLKTKNHDSRIMIQD